VERTVAPARPRAVRHLARPAIVGLAACVALAAATLLVGTATDVPPLFELAEPLAYVLAALLAVGRPLLVRAQRAPWSWFAGAITARAGAMLVYLDVVPVAEATRATAGSLLWTLSAVLLLAGAAVLATVRLPRPSLPGTVDLLVVGAVAVTLVATVLVGSLAGREGDATPLGALLLVAFPALDVALVVVLAAFVVAWRWRPPLAIALVTAGGVGVASANLLAVARAVEGTTVVTPGLRLLALLSIAALAVAAVLDDHRVIPPFATGTGGDARRPAVLAVVSVGLLVAASILEAPSAVVLAMGVVTLALVARVGVLAHADRTTGAIDRAMAVARVGDWQVDTAGRHTWSPTMYAILGVAPSVPATQGLYESLVHPEDRELRRDTWAEAVRTGRLAARYRVVRPDGEVRVVELQATNPGTVDGRPLVWTGTIQDITEQVAYEEAIQRSEQALQDVLALTNDGWFTEDLTTGETFHSARWWQLHGYEPGDVDEAPDAWKRLTHPDDVDISHRTFEAAVEARSSVWTLRLRALHKDGHTFPILVRGSIDYDDDGRPRKVSGVATDLSAAERADQAKAAFLSTISHELRTPLTSIGGALETVREGRVGEVPDTMVQLLELADRNTRRLRALVDDLLDIGRLQAGQATVRTTRVAARSLLEQAIDDHRRTADEADVRLVLHDPPRGLQLDVDPIRLAQVLGNLLANALRYAPAGTAVELSATRPASDRCVLEVTDHGPGLPPDFVAHAFEPFTQADTADVRRHGGTGLGLAICHEIVGQLGGAIDVESAPGCTTFRVELPIRRAPSEHPDAAVGV
jgi:PAS domain S-box-containing protein